MPTLEIGDNGEATFYLWCKDGKGQFSVAGNTVIFVPGPMQERACSPELAAFDDRDRRIERGRDLEAARRHGLVSRNEIGAVPDQYELNCGA